MSFSIKTTTRVEDAAKFVASSILNQLRIGKKVLFFVTGGSSIAIGAKVAELLRNNPEQNLIENLTIMMTDERYGPLDHKDSNWHQLMEKGFSLPNAKLIPILTGEDRATTVKNFNANLNQELIKAEYKISLFGIGADGHTCGILPESGAVTSEDLAYGYDTPTFSRVTITPKVIEKLDEAVVWVQGEEKWKVIEDLIASPVDGLRPREKDIDITKQPAQILKKVPLLTIFTDYPSSGAKLTTGQVTNG